MQVFLESAIARFFLYSLTFDTSVTEVMSFVNKYNIGVFERQLNILPPLVLPLQVCVIINDEINEPTVKIKQATVYVKSELEYPVL